jgi:hypothetical protein
VASRLSRRHNSRYQFGCRKAYWTTARPKTESRFSIDFASVPSARSISAASSENTSIASYSNATITSWNWSFLPLDVVLSIFGLASLRLSRLGDLRWRPLAILSLAMTVCAGLMAISFWAIRRDFSVAWWGFNLFLMLYPIPFLIDLIACQPARPPEGA